MLAEPDYTGRTALAQVHATLALAAATALRLKDDDIPWREVMT